MDSYGQTERLTSPPLHVDTHEHSHTHFMILSTKPFSKVSLTELEVLELLTQLWEWTFNPQLIKERKEARYDSP